LANKADVHQYIWVSIPGGKKVINRPPLGTIQCESNGHATEDVTWPWKVQSAIHVDVPRHYFCNLHWRQASKLWWTSMSGLGLL